MLATLLGTNISHPKTVGKVSFLSHWWDTLVPWRVVCPLEGCSHCAWLMFESSVAKSAKSTHWVLWNLRKSRCITTFRWLEILKVLLIWRCVGKGNQISTKVYKIHFNMLCTAQPRFLFLRCLQYGCGQMPSQMPPDTSKVWFDPRRACRAFLLWPFVRRETEPGWYTNGKTSSFVIKQHVGGRSNSCCIVRYQINIDLMFLPISMKTCHFLAQSCWCVCFYLMLFACCLLRVAIAISHCWYFNPENSEEIRGDMYWTGWKQICCQHHYSREGIMGGAWKVCWMNEGNEISRKKYWSSLIISSVFDQPNLLACWDIGKAKALGMKYIICEYKYIHMWL